MRGKNKTITKNGKVIPRVTMNYFKEQIAAYLKRVELEDYAFINGDRTHARGHEREAGAANYIFMVNRGSKPWLTFLVFQSFYEIQQLLSEGKAVSIEQSQHNDFHIWIK